MKSEIHATFTNFEVDNFKRFDHDPQIWHMNGVKPQFMLTFKTSCTRDP